MPQGCERRNVPYIYIGVLEEFRVKIPFTPFEMDVLKFFNVAPSQIQLNSWTFIRGFEIVCEALELEPSVGVFFYFYGTKGVNKMSWVSISAHPGKKLFPTYASNFKKDWREIFVRVQGAPGCSEASVKADGKPKFLLCWTNTLVVVISYDFGKMTPYEQGDVYLQ